MPINEFGMGLILPMDIQAGSLTVGPLWWIAFLNYEVQSCHCFFHHLLPLPSTRPLFLPSPFFFFFLCDGLVFSRWASTPLAAGAVRYRHSGICVETQIRGRPDISGQWAWDACNTKPVMEVSPQTDIDVPWDCMTQNKQTDTNMLVSAVWSWNVKMIRPRTNSYEGSHRIHTIFVLTFMSFWVQLLFPVLFCAVYPHVSCCAPSRLSLGFPTLWLSSLVSPVPDLSHVYLGPRLCLALCQLVSFVLVSLCCSSWILPVFSGRVSFNCHQSVHVSFCCLYFCILYFLDFFFVFNLPSFECFAFQSQLRSPWNFWFGANYFFVDEKTIKDFQRLCRQKSF